MTYIKTIFQLTYFHKYSLYDIHNMMPWERLILVQQIAAELEKEENG